MHALGKSPSLVDRVFEAFDRAAPPSIAYAHCDIPCGIYDPHAAQIGALTVIRMVQLIQALQKPAEGASKEEWDLYTMQISRYAAVKEEHAKIVEHEIVILWTDYFKPEHVEKHGNLHDVVWKTAKLTSTVKQQINMDAAQQLLAGVQQIAEIFWDTKGVKTRRAPANQGAVGGELVYPA
ncbi:MAG TPA: superoxide dismutase, Ni [Chloroflexota bacterium]|jgi:nickel superoxide dismutase|nr:superoxide dismutase, Ni [Chloroflexota bacterium]